LCGKYPVGDPVVFLPPDVPPFEELFGVAAVEILPPKKLHLPVLADNYQGKLLAVLCTECVMTRQETSCNHTDSQRALRGVWTTPEINLALKLGYKLRGVTEAWHFPETSSYARSVNQDGQVEYSENLFSSFVKRFTRLKTEASGPPRHDMTDEEVLDFCARYRERLGDDLDPSRLILNKPLRACSKLVLNSNCE
jgi:hypothetical protein